MIFPCRSFLKHQRPLRVENKNRKGPMEKSFFVRFQFARCANLRVIFINKGTLRDDGKPSDLVSKYGRKDLNEVFLAIAREGTGIED